VYIVVHMCITRTKTFFRGRRVKPRPNYATDFERYNDSNKQMAAELDSMKSEIMHIRSDNSSVKTEIVNIKHRVG